MIKTVFRRTVIIVVAVLLFASGTRQRYGGGPEVATELLLEHVLHASQVALVRRRRRTLFLISARRRCTRPGCDDAGARMLKPDAVMRPTRALLDGTRDPRSHLSRALRLLVTRAFRRHGPMLFRCHVIRAATPRRLRSGGSSVEPLEVC